MKRRMSGLRIFRVFAVSALLLTGCSYLTEPAAERPEDMRGEITRIKTEGLQHQQALAEVLIEEDPSVPMDEWLNHPGTGYTKVLWAVMPRTRIYRQTEDGVLVGIGLDELTVGSIVRAWNTGYFVDTGLPRAYAESLVVVTPAP